MRPLYVNGVGLWTPGFSSPFAWVDGQRDPDVTSPPRMRTHARVGRYSSQLTRIALNVLSQACDRCGADASSTATIFGSANGEIQTAIEQLDMIERNGVPSVVRFKHSAHNTASGLFSIASRNVGFTTALSAGSWTFAMCLLEAWAWLQSSGGSAVVVVADERLPDSIAPAEQFEPLGIALHLSVAEPSTGTLGRISAFDRRRIPPRRASIPTELVGNPCSGGLFMVDAVVQARSGLVPLDFSDEPWSVEFWPGTHAGPG